MVFGAKREFRSFDGETLYYHVTGEGPPILLVNGFVCTTHYWPPVVEYLSQFGTVLTWDYRGHGRNLPPQNLETCNIPTATRDMKALLTHAGFESALLVGHSMGSQVIFEFYRAYPESTRGLISICGSCESPFLTRAGRPTAQQLLFSRAARAVRPFPGTLATVLKPLLKTQLTMQLTYMLGANRQLVERHYIDSLYAHVTSMDFSVSVRFFESMVQHSARDVLPNIDVPTMLIGGTRDALVPPATLHTMAQLVPHAEARLYNEGSHLAMLERFDDVMQDITQFLQRYQLR